MARLDLRPTAWDVRSAGATLTLGALLFAIACVVTAATDEGSVSWAVRAARTVPAVPLFGAAVTFVALKRAKRRGELLALESIGCSPARASVSAVAGAVALSVVAAFVLVQVRGATLEAFFPRATARAEIVATDQGFVDEVRSVRILADGTITRNAPVAPHAPSPRAQDRAASAAAVLVLLGAALPLLGALASRGGAGPALAGTRPATAVAASAATCAFCTFLLQAAAAGRAPAWLACLPAAALLIFASLRFRAVAW